MRNKGFFCFSCPTLKFSKTTPRSLKPTKKGFRLLDRQLDFGELVPLDIAIPARQRGVRPYCPRWLTSANLPMRNSTHCSAPPTAASGRAAGAKLEGRGLTHPHLSPGWPRHPPPQGPGAAAARWRAGSSPRPFGSRGRCPL